MATITKRSKTVIATAAFLAALLLALTSLVVTTPLMAHAENNGNASDAEQAENASNASSAEQAENEGSTSSAAKASGVAAIFADKGQTTYKNGMTVSTTSKESPAIGAAADGTVIANLIDASTRAINSAGIQAGSAKAKVSVANSTVSTNGKQSPIISASGTVEVDNLQAGAAASSIAAVEGSGAVLVENSTLASEGNSADESGVENAVLLYRAGKATSSADGAATFQAVDSTLSSAQKSGALFHLTNTQANIVLSNTKLDFDDGAAKLITAAGNSVAGWGDAGKNGAEATVTAIGQTLQGDIDVDAISTLNVSLLENSSWTGSSSISKAASGDALAENLTVNVEAGSAWIVSEDSTVTNLNLADGAKLVDENGKTVKITDADGNTLVDGTSDIEVKVLGDITTTMKASDANKLVESSIDRADFDEEFGTSTAFGTNKTATAEEQRAQELAAIITAWFQAL